MPHEILRSQIEGRQEAEKKVKKTTDTGERVLNDLNLLNHATFVVR